MPIDEWVEIFQLFTKNPNFYHFFTYWIIGRNKKINIFPLWFIMYYIQIFSTVFQFGPIVWQVKIWKLLKNLKISKIHRKQVHPPIYVGCQFLKFLSGFVVNCQTNNFRKFQNFLSIFCKNPPLLLRHVENHTFSEKCQK